MENKDNCKEEFHQQLDELQKNHLFSAAQKRKKLIFWFVRLMITVGLFYNFWDYHEYVKYALWVYAPFSVISLFGILFMNKILEKKLKKARTNVNSIPTNKE